MKEIPLTKGRVALVDDADFEMLNKYKWFAESRNRTFYARRTVTIGIGKYKNVSMHRVIMQTPVGVETDHSDGDGLNNQRWNLRFCTRSKNNMNRSKGKNNTSGYKGVSWFGLAQKWRSTINVEGRQIHLGLFLKKEEAYKSYCEASKKYHGEYGNAY
jgi:hypothetical protein